MFLSSSNEEISKFVADLRDINFYHQRDVVAIYFEKSRAAVMKASIYYPSENSIIYTYKDGHRIPPPPPPKPILNIVLGESANPKLEDLKLYKKQNCKVLHNRYEPLKSVFNSYSSEEIDFEGEFKCELKGLEEICDYLISEKRIVLSSDKIQLNQLMTKPHYKYCLLMLLREFKTKLL